MHHRNDIVAAAFGAAGRGAAFNDLRAQKLLFLIDRGVGERIGGPFFDFRPYLYGPLDREVYDVIRELAAAGSVQTDVLGSHRWHQLTKSGHRHGADVLGSLPHAVADYFRRAAVWIELMPYRRMLAAIYREYPEMAVNSVVGDLDDEGGSGRRRPLVQGMASAFDLMGTIGPPSRPGGRRDSDADAIRGDWQAVGADIEDAMIRFGEDEALW